MIGMDFGRKASNLLLKGSTTSASAMALGGAAVGGAYDGLAGDGDFVGGAMRGAVAGAGAKFASNMYGMGTARAIGAAANKGTSVTDGLQLSRFTSGFEQAGRRGYMHSGFSQRPGVNLPSSAPVETSAQGSMKAADRASPTPTSTSVPTSTKVEAPKGSAQSLKGKEANIRSQRAEELTIPAQEIAAARAEAARRENGRHVSFEAQKRLDLARRGPRTSPLLKKSNNPSNDPGTSERYIQHPKGRQIDMFGGGGGRTNTSVPQQTSPTVNPRQQDMFSGIAEDFAAYNRTESSMGLF